jgi:D-3-phosphoglycerate dehydrogenase
LINTARGALIDEKAVVMGLRNGRLSGVAVDVLADEHNEGGWGSSPLLMEARSGANVIITPHIGGCTIDAMHTTEVAVVNALFKELSNAR